MISNVIILMRKYVYAINISTIYDKYINIIFEL